MLSALFRGDLFEAPTTRPSPAESPSLLDWLQSGRLMLVDAGKQVLPAERWHELPEETQARALEDFHRIVRADTKAAVIFLRD